MKCIELEIHVSISNLDALYSGSTKLDLIEPVMDDFLPIAYFEQEKNLNISDMSLFDSYQKYLEPLPKALITSGLVYYKGKTSAIASNKRQ